MLINNMSTITWSFVVTSSRRRTTLSQKRILYTKTVKNLIKTWKVINFGMFRNNTIYIMLHILNCIFTLNISKFVRCHILIKFRYYLKRTSSMISNLCRSIKLSKKKLNNLTRVYYLVLLCLPLLFWFCCSRELTKIV